MFTPAVIQSISCFRTDLNCFETDEQKILINAGYAIASFQIYLHCLESFTEITNSPNNYSFFEPFKWPYEDVIEPNKIVKGKVKKKQQINCKSDN